MRKQATRQLIDKVMSETKHRIYGSIASLLDDKAAQVTDDTRLIGDGTALDSLRLVELCLMLEDMAEEMGFEFDWTSDDAMSRSRSMFRTAGALAAEFLAQQDRQK